MLIKVFCVLSMLPPGVCWRGGATGLLNEGGGGGGGGGGEQQASCLVAKQAVEFPQVYSASYLVCPLLGFS